MKLPTWIEDAVITKAVPGKDKRPVSKLNILVSFQKRTEK